MTEQSYIFKVIYIAELYIVFPTKTQFLLDKSRIKMENPGKKKENNKEEIPKKVCFKLPQKKHPNQLPNHTAHKRPLAFLVAI